MICSRMKILTEPRGGSMADITAARNTYGQYIRQRGPANNTTTGSRTAARVLWAAAVASWHALSDSDRLAWYESSAQRVKDFRITGSGSIGGMQAYLQAYVCNQGGTVAPGAPIPVVTPLEPLLADPAPLYNLNARYVVMTPAKVEIYTQGYATSSTYSAPGRGLWWALIALVDATAVGPYPSTLSSLVQTEHVARWGAVVPGSRTFVAVRAVGVSGCGVRQNCGFVDWV